MITFNFECDAPGCDKKQCFSLGMLSRSRYSKHSTFFDVGLALNRERGWRVEGNEKELPNWDCKVFCPDHLSLHRDAVKVDSG